ncbi:signal peptide peptidase SppA [Anaerosinus massiliensis]|uniref:signal peptide peptidase SppA n=1 Tax=Massilibacillus massiliensis TaxID=1806837 RepID=UPI000DA60044|nr:signal peptide peptidase SppA [Massilibacillus massiliensis]
MRKKLIMVILSVVILVSVGILTFGNKTVSKQSVTTGNKIAVIYVEGAITGGRGTSSILSENGGTDNLIKQLHEASDDPSVQGIVLRINSPGGSSTATEEVGEEIKKIRAQGKPIVTSMGDVAASGGYWLAACTDKIYANPTTLTGSIGVYMPYSNWEELYKKIGIRQEKIKSGVHKDILSSDRPMTEEERVILQTMVDEIYQGFVEVVAEGRHMELETVKRLADGRVYTGKQAKELGLVDELGNLYDAIDGLSEMAGIQGKPKIKEYGKNNPLSMLMTTSDKAEILKALLETIPAENDVKSVVPMAIPAKW